MRHHLITVSPPPREASLDGQNLGLSGRDRRLARDPQLVDWFTKVYVEQDKGSRDWPEFNRPKLAQFLSGCGVNLEAAKESHDDALSSMPPELADAEKMVPRLTGASFLASSAEHVCFLLRKRHNVTSRA